MRSPASSRPRGFVCTASKCPARSARLRRHAGAARSERGLHMDECSTESKPNTLSDGQPARLPYHDFALEHLLYPSELRGLCSLQIHGTIDIPSSHASAGSPD